MDIAVLELENDKELGKYAKVQLEEFGLNADRIKIEQLIDLPGTLSRKINEYDACIVLADITDKEYTQQVIGEIISIETQTGKKIEKLFKKKGVQDRHSYTRELKKATNQKAEKLATELKNK